MSVVSQPTANHPIQSSDSASAINTTFLKILPAVRTHAAIQFRHLKPADREEAIAEASAAAFVNLHQARRNGRSHCITPSTLARFAVLHVQNGRHVGGSADSVADVMSRKAQRLRGFSVSGLAWDHRLGYDCLTDPTAPVWRRELLDDRRTPVADQAAFRIDLSTFLRRQGDRTRRVLSLLAAGHAQVEVADQLGVTPSAICQRIKRAEREWKRWRDDDANPTDAV